MNKLHTFMICIIIGAAIAIPDQRYGARKRRDTEVLIDVKNGSESQDVIVEIVPTIQDVAQRNDMLVVDELDDEKRGFVDDMEVAETHIFRPLFRYRLQVEQKKRIQAKKEQTDSNIPINIL